MTSVFETAFNTMICGIIRVHLWKGKTDCVLSLVGVVALCDCQGRLRLRRQPQKQEMAELCCSRRRSMYQSALGAMGPVAYAYILCPPSSSMRNSATRNLQATQNHPLMTFHQRMIPVELACWWRGRYSIFPIQAPRATKQAGHPQPASSRVPYTAHDQQ